MRKEFFHADIAYKTDTLTIFLFGDWQVIFSSQLAYFAFLQITDWKKNARKVTLIQSPEKVALVFLFIFSFLQHSLFNFCVMSSCYKIRSHFSSFLPKRSELNFFITEHIGIRGSTDLIFGYYLVHYTFFIFIFKIKKEEQDIEHDCYFHGVAPFVSPTARQEIRLPDFNKNPSDIKSALFQKRRANRGINATRKSDKNFLAPSGVE